MGRAFGREKIMTLKEISQRVLVSIDQLNLYEKNGLLEHCTLADGTIDYVEKDVIPRIGWIQTLRKYGMELEALKQYFSLTEPTQQIRLLRRQRYQLLDEIHEKQKALDELDYMIWTMRKSS